VSAWIRSTSIIAAAATSRPNTCSRSGHERIAFVGGRPDASTHSERFAGYCDAMANAGVDVPAEFAQHGDFTRLSGSILASRLVHLEQRPSALVCADDLIALGCMDALHEAGLRVPIDKALVGFDDIPTASVRSVGLTTIRQPCAEMGARAVRLLIDRIDGRAPPIPVSEVLPAELIIRTSCGTVRGASAAAAAIPSVGSRLRDLIGG
jgi:LacI family transcriptional regulator